MANEVLENLAPEERHRPYKLLHLNVYSRLDWPLEIKGIFANIEDELQTTVCRAANSRHLAYKGAMARTTPEGTTSGVR